jgi:hypothetical protein
MVMCKTKLKNNSDEAHPRFRQMFTYTDFTIISFTQLLISLTSFVRIPIHLDISQNHPPNWIIGFREVCE